MKEATGMRGVGSLLIGLVCVAAAAAVDNKEVARRYSIDPDLKTYPQATPKEALASVLKAIEAKRIDYLLAQLADPTWVDDRVRRYGGKFATLVEETTGKLIGDPRPAKQLRHLLEQGTWDVRDTQASVRLKGGEHDVFLRKSGERWFMENRKKE
jgi:hypothetical protein